MECPKCRYQRTITDQHVVEGVCPACGIAYRKWKGDAPPQPSPTMDDDREKYTFAQKLWGTLTYVPDNVDAPSFWGRVVLLGLFGLWGLSFWGSTFLYTVFIFFSFIDDFTFWVGNYLFLWC